MFKLSSRKPHKERSYVGFETSFSSRSVPGCPSRTWPSSAAASGSPNRSPPQSFPLLSQTPATCSHLRTPKDTARLQSGSASGAFQGILSGGRKRPRSSRECPPPARSGPLRERRCEWRRVARGRRKLGWGARPQQRGISWGGEGEVVTLQKADTVTERSHMVV